MSLTPRRTWALSISAALVALATLGTGCVGPGEPPAVPLYPNSQMTRLPPGQVAIVDGPISLVDARDVGGQGGRFELLPGCHIVELERQITGSLYGATNGMYFSGQFPRTVYALRMLPGGRYLIRRDIESSMGATGHIVLSAREELPTGAASDLFPAKSLDEVRACKAWQPGMPR
jgi:hypothetical protein